MHSHIALSKPSIIIPTNDSLTLLNIMRGSEYDHARERDLNAHRGVRGYGLKYFYWPAKKYLIESFQCEEDLIGRYFDIIREPELYTDVLLFLTQSLTTGAGSTQSFSVPATWGPNTSYAIGGGGNGGAGTYDGTLTFGYGGGGGGGALAASIIYLDRNGSASYFIGSSNQNTWFKDTGAVLAAAGNNGSAGSFGGSGGLTGSSVGTVLTKNGGNGGAGATTTVGGTVARVVAAGAGGGGAGGTSADGTIGSNGAINSATGVGTLSQAGGNGGASDTVAGATGSSVAVVNGNNGTDFDASHGAGSGAAGGGGNVNTTGNVINKFNGGAGGNYGAGGGGGGSYYAGGGAGSGQISSGGAGQQGMIFLSWSPYQYSEFYGS